jgi:hypothetical protein
MKVWMLAMVTGALSGGAVAMMACGNDVTDPPAYPSSAAPDSGTSSGTSGMSSGTSGMSSGTSGMSSGTSGAPGSATALAFCTGVIGGFFIDTAERCCSATEKAAPSYAQNKSTFQNTIDECTTALEPSVTAGRVKIDSAALAKCTASLKSGPCLIKNSPALAVLGSCLEAVVGMQALGAACRIDADCQAGTSCVGYSTTADGTCQTPAIGAPCGHAPVDGGAFPNNFTNTTNVACAGGGLCTSGTCVAGKAAGQMCGAFDCSTLLSCHLGTCGSQGPTGLGTPCLTINDCELGLHCTTPDGSTTQGTCEKQKLAGATCSSTILAECAGTCTVAMGATTGTCSSVCGSN